MKLASSILCCTLLGIGVGSALASPITVSVTAHVTQLSDSAGALGGQIPVGQVVTGTYTYETSTPNLRSTTEGWGQYQPSIPPASVSLTAGSLVFQSGRASQITVDVGINGLNPLAPAGVGMQIEVIGAQTLASGAFINVLDIDFSDPTGQFPSSIALPTGAPSLQSLANSEIRITGGIDGRNPGNWSLYAQIDSVQLVPPSIEVIPAAGDILPQQHFDAALLLSPGVQITSMQASVGGNPLTLSYPGTCQLMAPNSAGRPAILCPNANTVLPAAGGVTQILWQVGLANGTQLSQTVQWTVTP